MASGDSIVVFLPNWVGDVVMATPALRAMRSHWPDARIVHVGRATALDTLGGTGWADDVVVDSSSRPYGVKNFLHMATRLRHGRFGLAVLLPNSFRTAALARLAGVRRIAGYDRDARGWLLSDKLAPPRDEHGRLTPICAIDYYIELAALLEVPCISRRMELGVTDADETAAEILLREAAVSPRRPIVMLNPGSSFGPSKMWQLERFAAVADELVRRRDAQIIINAAPSERPVAAHVALAMHYTPAINFADRDNTIALLKSIIRRCTLLITNDTGARHLAAAFGIGVVTLFGSTDPQWTRIDYGLERTIRVDVPCSPCQQKMCYQPAGPAYHQCMKAITPQMVLAAAEELLDITPAAVGGWS